MPMVALRGLVVFPEMTLHFDVGRPKSVKAVRRSMEKKTNIFLATQMDLECDDPRYDDIYSSGVVCEIKQVMKLPGTETLRVVVYGLYRAELLHINSANPFLSAVVRRMDTENVKPELAKYEEALVRNLVGIFEDYAYFIPKLPSDIVIGVSVRKEAGEITDYILSNIPLDYAVKQSLLDELNPLKRAESLCLILKREIELLSIEEEINEKVQEQMEENQREYYLREQIKAISEELNEGDGAISESEEYREQIRAIGFSEDIERKLLRECDRLMKMQSSSPESAVIRNYLDKIIGLPWGYCTEENLDIEHAEQVLDNDHYGLADVKERIIEFLAVRKINPDVKGQIICLAGPPGVGKTSIARSLANAMGRSYARISLGGVRDEADIRGHRKTYIGSMPGRIIEAIESAKSSNPLILLDEVDKLGSDHRGDPSSALLEVLDAEQNNSFVDHYLEIPYDLSKVLFITTANDKSRIPAPLLDRMEIIDIPGYTYEEKFNIAKKHLVPKQIIANGLKKSYVKFTDKALKSIINGYTKEAGVRVLERTIAKVLRKIAVEYAKGFDGKISIKDTELENYLGPVKFKPDESSKFDQIGVVNGLAYTSVGGTMLTVEVAVMDGKGNIELTGSLGDVIKESAKAAISFIRTNADKYRIDKDFYQNKDIHIHFPEGAVPKDGPSAGVTIFTALVSALSGCKVKSSVAMTGEITVTGRVLPIGGLREKTMAAYVEGIKTVVVPEANRSDLDKIDEKVKEKINFVFAKTGDDVLKVALV
ncbi:MAG: endopeptidase La, partial [Clostridia bacterium]|nr:endopeptidase La [Clostridia bacterium]